MTNRERMQVLEAQNGAFIKYTKMCIVLNEVPKPEIILLIGSCEKIKKLDECVVMFDETIKQFNDLL